MKSAILIFALCVQTTFGQGWQVIGPDSTNWQNVRTLRGRWISPALFHLSATTTEGVAIYAAGSGWNYRLRNIPESIVNNGVTFSLLEFLPWEPDSCLVGHYIAYTEADLHLVKCGFPPAYIGIGGGARGGCWVGPIGALIPPNNPNVVFGGVCGVQRSTDRGSTWQNILPEEPWGVSTLVGVDNIDPMRLYRTAGDYSFSALFRTTNGGSTWDSLRLRLPPDNAWYSNASLLSQGDTIVLGLRAYPSDTSSRGAILRSIDGGATWSTLYDVGRVLGMTRAADMTYFATSQGVLSSSDWGTSLTVFNNGLPTTSLTGIIAHPGGDTVYVSTTTHGVLKVWRFVVGIDGSPDVLPASTELRQNYPNPFNPTTTIQYDIKEPGHVSIVLYDILGRAVQTLVNRVQPAGRYTILLDGSHLATGVYLYTLRSGAYTATHKLLLAK
jgi:hypothetical protein